MTAPMVDDGSVRQALARAALVPGTVRHLAARAQVGHAVAKVTASRMVAGGQLLVLLPGRPAVVAAPSAVVFDPDHSCA